MTLKQYFRMIMLSQKYFYFKNFKKDSVTDKMSNLEELKSYSEMMAKAKAIHPDMKVRLSERGEKWEFYMITELQPEKILNESFKGTHAWELYETFDPIHSNKLNEYKEKHKFLDIPLEAVAERVNIDFKRSELTESIRLSIYSEYGVTKDQVELMFSHWNEKLDPELDEEHDRIFGIYLNLNAKAVDKGEEPFKPEYETWYKKWFE